MSIGTTEQEALEAMRLWAQAQALARGADERYQRALEAASGDTSRMKAITAGPLRRMADAAEAFADAAAELATQTAERMPT